MRRFRRSAVLAVVLALAATACGSAHSVTAASSAPPGPSVVITGASVNGGHLVASYTLTQNGNGLTGADATATRPSWTLATLGKDPVSGIAAWQSLLLTGGGTIASLPIDGPGTPTGQVLTNVKQPGTDTGGTLQDLGGGNFTYTYGAALPQGLDPSQTLRVGVYLGGTPGTTSTSSTFDFVPGGGAVQSRELVLDANCNRCHGVIQAHGGFRTGTKLCVTCHTYQNADPDTVDPAALSGATPATNPNPLDLGRLVHRIHRGKELPTLFSAADGTPVVGQKYSVIGFQSAETVYGQAVNRTDHQQPAMAITTGVGFPQELRNCEACHGGAAQAASRFTDISRRTCGGCHPDVWFQSDPIPATDLVHTPHPAGPQADDTGCASCHVPTGSAPAVADVTAIHVAPEKSPHWNGLSAQIVAVQGMQAGQHPVVVFTLSDRDGTPTPLGSPTPAMDAQSPVPRKLGSVTIVLSGPTAPDYATGNAPISESVPLTTIADANGHFNYTFKAALPASATGTWAVGLEARRSSGATAPAAWPFTGESINEWADNPVEYVDTAVGIFPGGAATVRRQVILRESCNACHSDLTAHGDLRHNPEYCVMCHAPDATDWVQRPKAAGGNTNLGGTFDDIEERSIHFKVLIHRIHTGEGVGSAQLELASPMVVYGFRGSVNFLDDVRFPNNLAQCGVCHASGTFEIESVPASASPTVANEHATILHKGTPAHASNEPAVLPVTAACMGCHNTNAAQAHAQTNTINGKENCVTCHGKIGFMSVDEVHGLQ
jgi:OmcA/MtrC family decaheme c-type cytochrome